MFVSENYVYKKEVDWSLLQEGFTLPIENQVVFGQTMGHFLKRGESKQIKLYLGGKSYYAKIYNVNFDPRHKRRKDTLQIRYPRNGGLSKCLQSYFIKSYNYIDIQRKIRKQGERSMIKLPNEYKEYLAIYTTQDADTYILDAIVVDDILELREVVKCKPERILEASFNYDVSDDTACIVETARTVKIRKLNKKIGDNLKLLYGYRCQICGKLIGEEYSSHVVEAHHIDYFVHSINNDQSNQMIVCPNHHSIIHDINPVFDRKRLIFIYPNEYQEGLKLNLHL